MTLGSLEPSRRARVRRDSPQACISSRIKVMTSWRLRRASWGLYP